MAGLTKNMSPFSPNKPVQAELFVGRRNQIKRIVERGVVQVAAGKPMAFFVEGEYGIGKSSIANLVRWLAERDFGLFGVYAPLGGAKDLRDVAEIILQRVIRAGYFDPTKWEALKNKLAKYVGDQQVSLFGFDLNLNLAALKSDAPQIATHFGLLTFLSDVLARLRSANANTKGVMLVLDEINGIAGNPDFAMFLKSLWDANVAEPNRQLPLMLVLCGTKERRFEMMDKHEPVERIFDLVQINPLEKAEMEDFFKKAFGGGQMTVDPDALEFMARYSAGFPRIMHLVGDAAYWLDTDGRVSLDDATAAVMAAAEELGRKFVDAKVYDALQSTDYQAILRKIGQLSHDATVFDRKAVLAGLTESQRGKFDNFLTKMKQLNVIRQGTVRGEYEFTMRMVRLYIWLRSLPPKNE